MKLKMIVLVTGLATAMVTTSCTTGGPTIASLGAGSDAAYMNATRGRADAQISEQQALQYSRQQRMVSQEMDLEQKKRDNFMRSTSGTLDILNSARRLVY